ncbi:MAG: hypothetical protein LUQ68_04780 [Methylococcaceae bacterium]|jgi:hypothetical protein|nr:hypothetical protein [Methylococcaceae bacterium]
MTDQPIAKPAKPVRKPVKKVNKPLLNPDERMGTQAAQLEMHAFLSSLTSTERSTIERYLAVWKPGTQAFNAGYRKMIRYSKFWMQNQGKPVDLH